MKNILLIATGGTIACSESSSGLTPKFDAKHLLAYISEVIDICNVESTSIMSVDSSNMNPDLIAEIAETVYKNYASYDGFVITHGTDTMAYTASALAYMLKNLRKPVVLTGSQRAMEAKYTDAKRNVSDALRFAAEDINGVFVAFDGKLINATRAKKSKTRSTDAFISVNFPEIAKIKFGKIKYNNELQHEEYSTIFNNETSDEIQLQTNYCKDIMLIKLFPGIKPEIFDFIKENYKGVIIESFGIGGIPNNNPNIVQKLYNLLEEGISVVITTQCLEEDIDLSIYEVGKCLSDKEVIFAADMNTEAIVMKFMWALGNYENMSEVKYYMENPVFWDIKKRSDDEQI